MILIVVIDSSVIIGITVMNIVIIEKLHSGKHIHASRTVRVARGVAGIDRRVVDLKHLKK